ncbi:ribonuclease Z [Ochrobactrum sp. RH2CCR150]|uniref:MBL fold metallo-hydrolase n=1 Tax=Ochrobactrum sp. RH2CCR150 TaxID=2587044 RepID=UPI0015FCF34A|nr:ribonuclease BN (tRNA processing enzyme) [Ochrobactrum sp. RH2CCR150]
MMSTEISRDSAPADSEKLVVTVIGAGTILPTTGRSPSSHLLRYGSQCAIFDLGPGSLNRLALAGVDYREISTVFISHLHPDHVLDIVTLLHALNATPGWVRREPLIIAGCYGLKAFIEQLLQIFRDAMPETYTLDIRELTVGRHEIANLTVETGLTGHTSNSIAFRIETPVGIFVYSGDAIDKTAMEHTARQADIFLCECSFEDDTLTEDHLTPKDAATIASVAGVGQLVLIHTYPHVDLARIHTQATARFSGPVTIATDGTRIQC